MCKFHRTIFATICGLILLLGFGVELYALGPCLSEVLSEQTEVWVDPTGRTLDCELSQGQALGHIPEKVLNNQGTKLAKSFEIALPSGKGKGRHNLKEPLKFEGQNGRTYRLRENTDIHYTLPDDRSVYKLTIPQGTALTKIEGTTPQEYTLAKATMAGIIPPKNSRVILTIHAQTVVERAPGTGGMGTTLRVEPEKGPVGEYITLTVQKDQFDFSKAQFFVCLRKQGSGNENKAPFIPSTDVELKAVQTGKAELQARIPDIKERGVHCAKAVDLLVVARIPGGQTAEVISQQFKVSSRGLAIICWIIAFALPWLVAGFFMRPKKENQPSRFSPIRFVSGKYGGASLSLAQILLWSILVFSASFYVLVVSGRLLDLTPEVLTLLGIAGGSSIIAKITASAREDKGREILGKDSRVPSWLDLFKTEGRPDLYKVQMALFTTLAAFFVTGKIYGTLQFPELPAGLLTLIGISNGVYLGAKATSKTVLEKLAEKERELKEAEEESERLKVGADEAAKAQQKAQDENTEAIRARDTTKKLDTGKDAKQKVKLNELLDQQKRTAQETERRFNEANQRKTDADAARNVAERQVQTLKEAFKNMKAEALKQV